MFHILNDLSIIFLFNLKNVLKLFILFKLIIIFFFRNCLTEMILFALAAFYKTFVLSNYLLLKLNNYSTIELEKKNLWKTVQTAFIELLRIASLVRFIHFFFFKLIN